MLTIEPALDPKNKISFLLDWELTLRCNLDCTYCMPSSHDNSTQHPELEKCLAALDFMFEYVDIYMKNKAPWSRSVVMNVYGGESIFHPDISTIHKEIKQRHLKYKDNWNLLVQTTTNLVAGPKLIEKLTSMIDSWTVSYHTESSPKQKQQVRDNLLFLKSRNAFVKVIVLMNPKRFDDALGMIEFCKEHNIDFLPRQLDDYKNLFPYSTEQIQWFENLYNTKTYNTNTDIELDQSEKNMSNAGRGCCGGRQVCLDQNYKERHFFIQNNFKGWNCSVNWFFLFVKQIDGNIFVNKDCKMRFDGTVGPIGNLTDTQSIIDELKDKMNSNTMPVMNCAKEVCVCGICAPKSSNLSKFKTIMDKYLVSDPFSKS
jgi:MoaA/NifB/PqqE/SkfB family radical SAM enzyme